MIIFGQGDDILARGCEELELILGDKSRMDEDGLKRNRGLL